MITTLHLFGPFSIHIFGLMILMGIGVVSWLVQKHPTYTQIMGTQSFLDILCASTVVGIVGARLLYVIGAWPHLTHWTDAIAFWREGNTGFSGTGAIIAIICFLPFKLHRMRIPIVPFMDMLSIYAPLLQMFVRIGCFFAGCCYGLPTEKIWGIMYTDPQALAPLCTKLHPTQLYSAMSLFILFLLLYFVIQRYATKPGQLLASYLILVGIERFVVDFWRNDRELYTHPVLALLSLQQWVGLLLIVAGLCLLTRSVGNRQGLRS